MDSRGRGLLAFALLLAALAGTIYQWGAERPVYPSTAHSPGPTKRSAATGQALNVAEAFIAFANTPGDAPLPPFAQHATLLLGPERSATYPLRTPNDPKSWMINTSPIHFRGAGGVISPLAILDRVARLSVTLGSHPTCAVAAAPPSGDLAELTYVSIQPTQIESCLDWFAVDLLLDAAGSIEAVILDLYEP